MLGEELHGGDGVSDAVLASEHLWIVDPIDGTNNFVHGIPHFGVSVAYYHQGRARLRRDGQSRPATTGSSRPADRGPITMASLSGSPRTTGSTRS